MRPLNEIIIHCTATRAEWMGNSPTSAKVAEIDRWHRDRGFNQIGYHYLIDRDGTVATGRPLEKVGAHVKGRNTGSIGISLFGGHGSSENDAFADNYTPQQEAALLKLLRDLREKYPSIKTVSGHNQYAAKACPGFNVPRWYANKPPRTSPVQSTTIQAVAGAATAGAGGVATVLGSLDPVAQYIVLGAAAIAGLFLLYIVRERLRRWAEGDR